MSKSLTYPSLLVCAMLLLTMTGTIMGESSPIGTRQDLVLRIGVQDDMKTRNYLVSPDMWTSAHLDPVYDVIGKFDPATEEPLPYIVLGVDADENGVFDLDEYGKYAKDINTREVTAYYDMNGVYFHDGVQATMDDLLFSYHLWALHPVRYELDVLKDLNYLPGSNYSTSRWLNVWPVGGSWDPTIPVGTNASLRFALHFHLETDFWGFVPQTLNGLVLMPRHVWERWGKVCEDASGGVCLTWQENIHSDFKRAYDVTTHNGVPATEPDAFKFSYAESWLMQDDEVIGTGPFSFGQWYPGVTVRIDKFWDYKEDALACFRSGSPPACTGDFYGYMHQPYIDGMLFKIYKTLQAAVFALQAGEIDHVGWSILPEFVAPLLADPNVDLEIAAASSFAYLSYNMRMSPFGYPDNDPTNGDVGLHLRRAVAHATDKVTVVTLLLQNFAVAGDQPVSPGSVKWYNESVTKYDYDLDKARQILDTYYTVDGLWADPAQPLGTNPGTGYRRLPSIGADNIEILCPQADHDPVLAQTCNIVANDMRAVGLNADAHLVAVGEISEKLRNRDSQMWLLENDIHTAPPDYYYSFFHSRNARVGLNHAGFQNQTFDDVLQTALSEMDVDAQATLIKQGSGILSSNLPCDPIFFRSYINAYRSDRFINWTVSRSASIFHNSYWSWIGVHPPWPVEIDVLLYSGNLVLENEVLGFEVLVTNGEGGRLDDVDVTLTVSPAGAIVEPDSGRTVDGSIGMINFTAPEVDSDTYFTVTVSAVAPWESEDSIDQPIKVIDVDTQPPEISDARAEPDPQDLGGKVNISAVVTDDKELDLVTCLVLDPDGNELENLTMEYDSASGRFYRHRSYDGTGDYEYTIWAYDDWGNSNWTTGSFEVVEPPLPLEYIALLSVIILIIALSVVFLLLKRRKGKEPDEGKE